MIKLVGVQFNIFGSIAMIKAVKILKLSMGILVISGLFYWLVIQPESKEREYKEINEKILSDMALTNGAIRHWNKDFHEEGLKLKDGYRSIYTVDIERASRNTGKPILAIGFVYDVSQVNDQYWVGMTSYDYPDLSFLLKCSQKISESILSQQTDKGEFFAFVAQVERVERPSFEVDMVMENDETSDDDTIRQIIVEPGDQYIVYGSCLDVKFLGKYSDEWEIY